MFVANEHEGRLQFYLAFMLILDVNVVSPVLQREHFVVESWISSVALVFVDAKKVDVELTDYSISETNSALLAQIF